MVVFDNVPWGFTPEQGVTDDAVGTYGNVRGPYDGKTLALYEQFASDVGSALADRYGFAHAKRWQYRVGSEVRSAA